MASSVSVGAFRALAAVPAASSLFDKGIGGKQGFSSPTLRRASHCKHCKSYGFFPPPSFPHSKLVAFQIRAEASGSEDGTSTSTATKPVEICAVDKLVEGISFGQLCDEFQCVSSPAVEKTARQLLKDILEIREGKRSIGIFGVFVQYKDPLRSFKGREKYKRANWIKTALDNPSVAVRQMTMESTSVLNVKWTLRGRPKLPPASLLGGDVVLNVNSTFTLNQISGQVTEHEDDWDLSGSNPLGQAYFWTSRLAFSTVEGGKDAAETVTGLSKLIDKGRDDNRSPYFPDPSGDPRKFFQVDDNPQRDFYQLGLVLALLYLVVQF